MKIDIQGPVSLTLNPDGSADLVASGTSLHLLRETVNSDIEISLKTQEAKEPTLYEQTPPFRPWGPGVMPVTYGATNQTDLIGSYSVDDALAEQVDEQLDLPLDFGVVKDVTRERTDMDEGRRVIGYAEHAAPAGTPVRAVLGDKKKSYQSRAGASVYGVTESAAASSSAILNGIVFNGS